MKWMIGWQSIEIRLNEIENVWQEVRNWEKLRVFELIDKKDVEGQIFCQNVCQGSFLMILMKKNFRVRINPKSNPKTNPQE